MTSEDQPRGADASPVLVAGSGASITMDADRVVKRGTPADLPKLRAEGLWLRHVGSDAGLGATPHFPAVQRLPTPRSPELVLSRLPGRNVRQAVMAGEAVTLLPVLESAVDFATRIVPTVPMTRHPRSCGEWYARHLVKGVAAAAQARPQLEHVLSAPALSFDGERCPNPLANRGRGLAATLRAMRVPKTVCVHGDLHLGNILVSAEPDGFAFVDPRGAWGSAQAFDPAYDIAKLLHEPHYLSACLGVGRASTSREGAVAIFSKDGQHEPHASLRALTQTSLALAKRSARLWAQRDPAAPARATLVTGVLLLTVMRFAAVGEADWQRLLANGVMWSTIGLYCLDRQLGLHRVEPIWDDLLSDILSINASTMLWSAISHDIFV